MPRTMTYQAVLFDLDGTLLDTLDDLADSTNLALRQLGFPEHPTEAYKIFVGDGVQTLIERVLPADKADPATVAKGMQIMRAHYSQNWARKTRPYDGIPELLDGLTARRVALTVFSNKPDDFTKLCVEKFLGRWKFAAVMGGLASRPKKPDPAGALAIAEQLQLKPEQFVYLGDTNTDMQTAVAAGMYPVGALWGFRGAEELLANGALALIEQPTQLLNLIDR